MDREKKRAFLSLAVLLSIFLFSALFTVQSAERFPLCLFRYVTHVDCPGCGLVRSFISISHAHWIDAVRFNALGPLVYLLFLAYLIQAFFRLFGKRPFSFRLNPGTLGFVLFAVLFWGQWFLKVGKGLGWI